MGLVRLLEKLEGLRLDNQNELSVVTICRRERLGDLAAQLQRLLVLV